MTARTDNFEGLHVLLVTEDDARAQAIAKSLRERKAHVGDVRAGAKDPVALRGADLLVIDARRNASTDARVADVRSDVRARWASVATIDYATLANEDGTVDLRALEGIVSRLAGMDKALTERARKEPQFETVLAPLGPTRTLRALALAGPTLHVELTDGTLSAEVSLADELLVAASATRKGERWEAHSALARVLGMTDANVVVHHRSHPATMNIMEPVDQALEGAAQERARAPEQFAEEQLDEISGLRGERKQSVPAAASVAAAGSVAPKRAPSLPSPSQVIPAPSVRPGTARPSFGDTPTDPAAPGLLQRMARAPANDAPAAPAVKSEPVLSVERGRADDQDDDFDGEEQYDTGEVTVVADASQLDILRETLGRIDGPAPNEPLTSTMPAPPGSAKEADDRALDEALKSAGKKPTGDWPTDYELPKQSVPPPAPVVEAKAEAKPEEKPATSTPPVGTSHAPKQLRLDESTRPVPVKSNARAMILVALIVMATAAVGAMLWVTQQPKSKAAAKTPAPAKR